MYIVHMYYIAYVGIHRIKYIYMGSLLLRKHGHVQPRPLSRSVLSK